MCVAVPAEVLEIKEGNLGVVDYGDLRQEVRLDLVDVKIAADGVPAEKLRAVPIGVDAAYLAETPVPREFRRRFAPDENGNFPPRNPIGKTPLSDRRIARGDYKVYIEKPGYIFYPYLPRFEPVYRIRLDHVSRRPTT